MHVARVREGREDVELGRRQAGEAEQRQALRQVVEGDGGVGEGVEGVGQASGRVRDGGQVRAQAAPDLGLPRDLGGQGVAGAVDVLPGAPGAEHRGAVLGVAVEQLGEVADGDEAGRGGPVVSAGGAGAVLQVVGERAQPGLVQVAVDDLQQGPEQSLAGPGVGVPRDVRGGGDGSVGDRAGGRERDVGEDPVVGVGCGGAEPGRQGLRDPALHAPGGHRDDLARERVLRRDGEQVAERVQQGVGAGRAVDVEHRDGRAYGARGSVCSGVAGGVACGWSRPGLRERWWYSE